MIKKIIYYLRRHHMLDFLPDKIYIKLLYYIQFGKKIDLKAPKTYNEKLQWLKLYDRNPLYVKLVDKYEVKNYIKKSLGNEYVVPTIGVYKKFEEIDFSKLPQKFVIKCTHDSGGIVICKDKDTLDIEEARKKIKKSLNNNYYYHGREWPYKNVEPRIIIEELLEDKKNTDLKDYKFFCFNGKVKMLFIASNRHGKGETYFDFFDEKYNHLNFTNGHENAPVMPKKPKNFELMKELAEKVSKNLNHARIDFYEVNEKIYFGEITFFHWSGLVPYEPEEWDYIIGEWLQIPKERKEKNEK